jgi:hypothetical protein
MTGCPKPLIPFLQHLRAHVLRRVTDPTPYSPSWVEFKVSERTPLEPWSPIYGDDWVEQRVEVILGGTQTVPESEREMGRKHVAAELVHLLYGPVQQELLGILHELRREGVAFIRPDGSAGVRKLEALIEALSASRALDK